MHILSKKETSAFNKEIAEMIGCMSPSGVTHQYKTIVKLLEEAGMEKESHSIISIFNGLIPLPQARPH